MFHASLIVVIAMAMAGLAAPQAARAQIADPTFYSSAWNVVLDGRQCVPSCRDLAVIVVGKTLPYLGSYGTASQIWNVAGFPWIKVPNTGANLPIWFCVICFNGSVANGAGHVALCVGIKDPANRIVWLLDSNWYEYANGIPRGALHSVKLDSRVTGWLQ